ncbi:MAG TPA: hypothetical protein DDW52_07275 [Planctomycetaceae bacterium]|nr:hypothetical protein [Planctomycetaceae bacterium]
MTEQTDEHKEPSLAPACLVVAILGLAAVCAFCGFGSWIVFSDQYPFAYKGIDEQLIPWVKQSQLAPEDKASIVDQLQELLPIIEERSIDKEQLLRLRNCLQDNPILLWGGVQSILEQAEGTDLTETERETLKRLTERLMRMATDRLLARNDMEFTLQPCATVRDDQLGLEVRTDLTGDEIRKFMERSEQLLQNNDIPNMSYDKTPAEAFGILVEAALNPPKI